MLGVTCHRVWRYKTEKNSDLRDDNLDTATYTLLPTTFKMELDWKKDEGMGIMSFYKTF